MDVSFAEKMAGSIAEDWYIFLAAFFAALCLVVVWLCNREVDRNFDQWKSENHYSRFLYRALTVSYTFFLTLITVFPLLGMFGTVKSLLGLDFADTDAILGAKNSFFDALTSTAWGIIFALIYKIVNAFVATHADDNIRKMAELIDNKASNIDGKPKPKRRGR